jgi:hypothetical protein
MVNLLSVSICKKLFSTSLLYTDYFIFSRFFSIFKSLQLSLCRKKGKIKGNVKLLVVAGKKKG